MRPESRVATTAGTGQEPRLELIDGDQVRGTQFRDLSGANSMATPHSNAA